MTRSGLSYFPFVPSCFIFFYTTFFPPCLFRWADWWENTEILFLCEIYEKKRKQNWFVFRHFSRKLVDYKIKIKKAFFYSLCILFINKNCRIYIVLYYSIIIKSVTREACNYNSSIHALHACSSTENEYGCVLSTSLKWMMIMVLVRGQLVSRFRGKRRSGRV